MPLYVTDEGQSVSTQSMLKTFRRCPKQAEYKYVRRLKPRLLGKPLSRGTWLHYLLEAHHGGGDWKAVHQQLTNKFNDMFDEERDYYGDMPTECYNLMLGYIWHYKDDPWKVLETEFVLETELPDGTIFRARVDAMVETIFGIYLVDHKSHKTLPDHNFRLLDGQSALYVWAALRNRLPIEGFIWNYIRTKAPSIPERTLAGRRSRRKMDTDWQTYTRTLRKWQLDGYKVTKDDIEFGNRLKSYRYKPGEPQLSSFFRRDVLEKQPDMLRRVALENYRTSRRMHDYDFSDPDRVERVVDRSCAFSCSYTDLCITELMGGNPRPLIRNNYTEGDPLDYYNDNDTPYSREQ